MTLEQPTAGGGGGLWRRGARPFCRDPHPEPTAQHPHLLPSLLRLTRVTGTGTRLRVRCLVTTVTKHRGFVMTLKSGWAQVAKQVLSHIPLVRPVLRESYFFQNNCKSFSISVSPEI